MALDLKKSSDKVEAKKAAALTDKADKADKVATSEDALKEEAGAYDEL